MDPESLSNSREFSLSPKRPCTCEQSSPLSSVFPGFADSLVSLGITGTPGTRHHGFMFLQAVVYISALLILRAT